MKEVIREQYGNILIDGYNQREGSKWVLQCRVWNVEGVECIQTCDVYQQADRWVEDIRIIGSSKKHVKKLYDYRIAKYAGYSL